MLSLMPRIVSLLGVVLMISACASSASGILNSETPASMPVQSKLPDLGAAADFNNNQPWINTEQPLTLASLRGKVILVEFWTFG